ncbi:MAG: hypothetical protein DI533_15455 [Cereibacter sphaeroides]|uniref:GtrA/DPMS transmembrane domain-containing protein n=1 Tax=Cereibacter sphaeroides TaxID=1063 RepID=A0A2W5S214_CERSP|nr:MAG: hypothetical protein DI533_15455 [Cereibacter sphaeroides]
MTTRIEVLKYLLLGGVNFFLTLAIFTGMFRVAGVNYIVALVGAWAAGMLFMYVTNFVWVFRHDGPLRFDDRFRKFAAVGVLSISANTVILSMIVEVWSTDPFWTQMALLPLVVAFNFAATKHFSLRTRPRGFDDRT